MTLILLLMQLVLVRNIQSFTRVGITRVHESRFMLRAEQIATHMAHIDILHLAQFYEPIELVLAKLLVGEIVTMSLQAIRYVPAKSMHGRVVARMHAALLLLLDLGQDVEGAN